MRGCRGLVQELWFNWRHTHTHTQACIASFSEMSFPDYRPNESEEKAAFKSASSMPTLINIFWTGCCWVVIHPEWVCRNISTDEVSITQTANNVIWVWAVIINLLPRTFSVSNLNLCHFYQSSTPATYNMKADIVMSIHLAFVLLGLWKCIGHLTLKKAQRACSNQ